MVGISVNVQDVIEALLDREGRFTYHLDRETGKVLGALPNASPATERARIEELVQSRPKRYTMIKPIDSQTVFSIMEEFAEEVGPTEAIEPLLHALHSPERLDAFLDALADFPEAENDWFEFETREYTYRALEWIKQQVPTATIVEGIAKARVRPVRKKHEEAVEQSEAGPSIRLATQGDAAAIAAIYGPHCTDGYASFETEEPTAAEMAKRLQTTTEQYPWLVLEDGTDIAGYAYASQHRPRGGYRWDVDVAVYVAPEYQRRGVATALYTALLALLRTQGYYNAYAGVAMPNHASVAAHAKFGFQTFTVYEGVGFKHGLWRDVAWMHLRLQDLPPKPAEPISIRNLTTLKSYKQALADGLAEYRVE